MLTYFDKCNMDENLNSKVLRLRNTKGDHNYGDSKSYKMVRLNQVNEEGEFSDTLLEEVTNTKSTGDNVEKVRDGTANKSSTTIIYPCYLCNYETCRSTSLVAHLRQHRQGSLSLETERFQIGKFMCSVCNFKTRWLSSLKEHEQKVHYNKNINNCNDATCNNNRSKENKFNCRFNCGYTSENLEGMDIHMRHHFTSSILFGNVIPIFPCCLCEFTSTQLEELQTHFKTSHHSRNGNIYNDRKTYVIPTRRTCTKCDYVFSSSEDILMHKHNEDLVPNYPCDYCSHSSPSIYLWRDHMETHGGVLEISLASIHN